MRITRRSGDRQRKVLIGMILDSQVAARISTCWESPGLFLDDWANLIGGWAIEHYTKHRQPIGRNIELRFDTWVGERERNEETVAQIERLLSLLSQEAEAEERFDAEYVIEVAGQLFDETRVKKLGEQIDDLITTGQGSRAWDLIRDVRRVNLGPGSYEDLTRFDPWVGVYDDDDEERDLISYGSDSALGQMLQGSLRRGGFIAFMGMNKSGKSFVLQDACVRALRRRCKVAYFEAGDHTRKEFKQRMGVRLARRPLRTAWVDWPKRFLSAHELEREKRQVQRVSSHTAYQQIRRWTAAKDRLRFDAFENRTLSAERLENYLIEWGRDGWRPDVVIIDYADIMLLPSSRNQPQHQQINELWQYLRAISQRYNCLLLTATQANARSFDAKRVLTRANFSGSRQILDHVTGMIGLNVLEDDEKDGCRTWNWIVRRDGPTHIKSVRVAACFSLGLPAVCSHLLGNNEDGDESSNEERMAS